MDPVLGYPNFSKGFILETQQGGDRKTHVIPNISHSLYPSEWSMHNYNSSKLKLLALKWVVPETFGITY